MKNLKTYQALQNKAVGKGRMPSLRMVSNLLHELNVEHSCHDVSTEKWSKPSGYRYYTSGGSRTYTGYHLRVPQIRLDIDSTETYYSWNTWQHARDLVELLKPLVDEK